MTSEVMPELEAINALLERRIELDYKGWGLMGISDPLTTILAMYPDKDDPSGFEMKIFGDRLTVPTLARVASYDLGPRIEQNQVDLLRSWDELTDSEAAIQISLREAEAMSAGVPITFLYFGCTTEDGEVLANLFHPTTLPAALCWNWIQGGAYCRANTLASMN